MVTGPDYLTKPTLQFLSRLSMNSELNTLPGVVS